MVERHSAGSRARPLPLLPGVTGTAQFVGEASEHRLRLDRIRGPEVFGMPFALFIGMNPSNAAFDEDDLTVRKEQEMTWRLGLNRYVKVNVGTYVATHPRDLQRPGVLAVWPSNIDLIVDLAGYADVIVAATGALPGVLVPHGRTLFRALTVAERSVRCFGKTRSGWPLHTSRLAYAIPLREFRL